MVIRTRTVRNGSNCRILTWGMTFMIGWSKVLFLVSLIVHWIVKQWRMLIYIRMNIFC